MLQESRDKIKSVLKPKPTATEISEAQNAIETEVNRAFFAPLLYVVSDFIEKPVELKDFSAEYPQKQQALEKIQKYITEETASNSLYANAQDEQKKLALERLQRLHNTPMGKFSLGSASRAIRLVTMEVAKQNSKVIIWVHSLDSTWLQEPWKSDSTISNADLLHISIAHEAVGLLFNIDSHKVGEKDEVTAVKEAQTHELSSRHFIKHVMEVKKFHNIPEFYSYHRADLILAFHQALQQINCTPPASFSATVGKTISEFSSKEGNRLKVCPREWESKCPNDIKIKDTCTFKAECRKCTD